jgi:NADH-quinone oxidoreductase subunit H
LCATVFLGGHGVVGAPHDLADALLGLGALTAKTGAMVAVVLFVRRQLPALRPDQALRIAWLALVPVALLGLVVVELIVRWRA